jgi:glycerol-3-phosphate acyltransferase PlsY
VGSGNIGAANMARAGGIRAGAITFILDFAKGFIPVFLALNYGNFPADFPWILGGILVWAHCYSLYLNLNGGKGVATAAGIFFALAPIQASAGLAAWGFVFLTTRITSLAAIAAVFVIVAALHIPFQNGAATTVSLSILLLIVRRHEENLANLISGAELRFK